MRTRLGIYVVVVGLGLVGLPSPAGGAVERPAPMVCTWGGTPADTTGTLEITPGLKFTPAEDPLSFFATGELGGGPGCEGVVEFHGVIQSGGTCATQIFAGRVKGLPGVRGFYGPGIGGTIYEFLYDKDGNVVGSDQPQVLTGAGSGDETTDCGTAAGFREGAFSSVIEIWG